MLETHLQIVALSVLILTVAAAKSKTQEENFAFAKRSLLERERKFFKNMPMSSDLKEFIDKYRQRNMDKRAKRSDDLDENLVYVIHKGQLVPLNSIKGFKRSQEEKKNDLETFTVVPLIIPVTSPDFKLVKARNLNEDLQGKDDTAAPVVATPASSVEDPTPVASLDEEEDTNSTKEETKVLHKILEDVEGLMQWKHEGNKKEGLLCNLNGSWISEAAGMRFDICFKNSTRKKFRIHVADRIPPNEDGFLCDGNWTVFGEIPFVHSGMVIALAVHEKDKHLATFIGECRICEGSETVTGTWLIGRSSRDCKDQKASHKILSDVWKREQAHTLRKKHLLQLGYTVTDED